jgi:hypothetical protein
VTPPTSLSMLAMADQAEAALREFLDDSPSFMSELRDNPRSQMFAQIVAVDVLAALSEACEESVQHRLDVVTSRLLAWQRLSA